MKAGTIGCYLRLKHNFPTPNTCSPPSLPPLPPSLPPSFLSSFPPSLPPSLPFPPSLPPQLTGTVSCQPSDHEEHDVGVQMSPVPHPAQTDEHESLPPTESQTQRLHPVPSPHYLLVA